MTRTNKLRTGLAALAISVTAFAGIASAATPTKVTIHSESGGFYGKVKSANPNCVSERTVVLFEQLGARQSPSTDQRILSDTTEDDGSWDTGNPGLRDGNFYARVKRSPGCKPASSRTIPAQP